MLSHMNLKHVAQFEIMYTNIHVVVASVYGAPVLP